MCHRWNEFFFYKIVFSGSSAFNFLKQVRRARTLKESQPCRLGALPPTTTLEEGTDFCPEGRRVEEKRKGGWESHKLFHILSVPGVFPRWQLTASGMRGKKQARSPHLMESQIRTVIPGTSYWISLDSTPCLTPLSWGSYWQSETRLLATVTAPLSMGAFPRSVKLLNPAGP